MGNIKGGTVMDSTICQLNRLGFIRITVFPHKLFNFLLEKISMPSNNIDTLINILVNKTVAIMMKSLLG